MKNFFNKYTIIVGAICLVVGFSFGAGGYYLLLPYRTLKISSDFPISGLDLITDTAKEIKEATKPVIDKKKGEDFFINNDNVKLSYKWTKEETEKVENTDGSGYCTIEEGMKDIVVGFDVENVGKKEASLNSYDNKFVIIDENDREFSEGGCSIDKNLFSYNYLIPTIKQERIVMFPVPKQITKFKYVIYHGPNEDYRFTID